MLREVNLRQAHIDKGVKQDCSGCPLALAVMETYKQAYPGSSVSVDADLINIKVMVDGVEYRALTPPEAVFFIRCFDQGIQVRPFIFSFSDSRD